MNLLFIKLTKWLVLSVEIVYLEVPSELISMQNVSKFWLYVSFHTAIALDREQTELNISFDQALTIIGGLLSLS